MGDASGDSHGVPDEDGPVTATRASLAAAALLFCCAGPAYSQTWRTLTSSRQLHGESSLTVRVRYGAGRLGIGSAEPGTLYRMELRYDEERFTPVREYDPESATLNLGTRGRGRVRSRSSRSGPQPFMDVELATGVPMNLAIETGASRADLDLGALSLRSLALRTGASETRLRFGRPNPVDCTLLEVTAGAAEFRATGIGNTGCRELRFDGGVGEVVLDFSGDWRRSMDADIEVGIGTLTLRLPRDLGVRIRLDRFLAAFEAAGLARRGGAWYSSNWDRARTRLTLNVEAALGEVTVQWLEP